MPRNIRHKGVDVMADWLEQVDRWWRRTMGEASPDSVGRGVLAVSGGPDSIALTVAMSRLNRGPMLLAHLDHQLRLESADDAEFVRAWGQQLGWPTVIERRDIAAIAANRQRGIEETARAERYAFLRAVADQHDARWIATGHTADDQAETVLNRVIRGTGLRGLRGIHPTEWLTDRIRLIRPLIEVRRPELHAWLDAAGVAYRIDASNADPQYTRNFLRHRVFPELTAVHPEATAALARLADQAGEWCELLEQLTESALAECRWASEIGSVALRCDRLRQHPPALVRECLRAVWREQSWPERQMDAAHWHSLAEVVTGERPSVDLPGGVRGWRVGVMLRLASRATGRTMSTKIPKITATLQRSIEDIPSMQRTIRRALLSVSDKTGLIELATALASHGVELISTGGTRTTLAAAGLSVRDISEVTGFPEMLDGRVKTLHPIVYAGILAKRDDAAHMQTIAAHEIAPIDLVVCNLYPFEKVVGNPASSAEEIIENIDIGGPTMVRATAKNYHDVAIITAAEQYPAIIEELTANSGALSLATREKLAGAAYARTAAYDAMIAEYFQKRFEANDAKAAFPKSLSLTYHRKGEVLRYGENPHQPAAFYVEPNLRHACIATAETLHGKELSYNNILDLDSAFNLVREFAEPAAVVIKHNNPCGAATAPALVDAFRLAYAGDPLSAFGGVLAFNRPVDEATALALAEPNRFIECIIAPEFEPAAFEILTTKPSWRKNVRLLRTGPIADRPSQLWDTRRVDGGLLVQARDTLVQDPATWKAVTQRHPTAEEFAALAFAWKVCKHVKSNAIVYAQGTQIVGVGAGQMSRVDSTMIAGMKAGERSRGAVLASDAFFPFRDNVDRAAAAGITAVVQPGGSQRDEESIQACNEHGMAMLFTGHRHFRH
ncbi:bifunctional phosphoribosylaminoimidazolecarboxamide formyltransferase/IMP cyclohydrolase [Tuwongella immobilis]|uniref:Bifunctional purine biosynthesis protein PurH n=1 Tax=Tuwongella immobilis TaxID=692036 RepID=A0A6C2YUK7_9BACT|nr:bifunctional phosphoribosylaminoimidazolecarboxamide formyltransferase/IMP cyclohydrolase [Tuwongella immobilis]VIP05071.1 phosphoribosylaminoimidazolecarboxamide formyltransferase : Bifunctional purine biosynthesis protein PurH OS=uncultured planctomycete GN=purH PE=3 SV=1: ATP_bind_3: MGS: AICARFT_IMPCHas [Tuwongella immobilis]VTS07498.1 phosphoribosylaminoimidazolecarboxamide formyltransferase : Bifunctional purine biosynthesis protein PurH OS=uncultured planctomycete GN=purH PE=3 SV=1: ATP